MNANVMGVGPLVCAICETTVGAINTPALTALLQADEIYVCRKCEDAFPEVMIETALSQQQPGHYAELVDKVQVVWAVLERFHTAGLGGRS